MLSQNTFILFVAGITVAIGLTLADDYGPSFDETSTAAYGRETLSAYLQLRAPEDSQGILRHYGPFFAASEAVKKIGGFANSNWLPGAIGHFTFFLSLPIAMVSLYYLAERWTTPIVALIATLLFGTQPLIFGHAFINPKDLPFLTFFLASVALGVRMAQKSVRRGMWFGSDLKEDELDRSGLWDAVVHFGIARWRLFAALLLALLGASAFAAELLAFQQLFLPSFLDLVRMAHGQIAWGPISNLFTMIAERSAEQSAEAYVSKAAVLYEAIQRPLTVIAFIPAIVLLIILLRPALRMLRPRGLFGAVLIAGACLGLATSVRVVGPFAGVLVSTLVVYRSRRGSIAPLVLYWSTAGIVAYLTWPYLWGAPIERFLQSVEVMRNVEWEFPVLFRGVLHDGSSLPRYYLPFIYGVQLTLSAIVLGAIGAFVVVRKWISTRSLQAEQVMTAVWILLPLSFTVLFRPAMYDNGRHYLFILPPVFLFASLGMYALNKVLRNRSVRVALAGIILLPGVLGIIRLHPYQYIYYNSLVGGVRGAYRLYELDYWETSLKESLEIVNEIAPPNSSVYINGPWENIWEFAREDLRLYDPPENAFDPNQTQYVMASTRGSEDVPFRRFGDVVHEIMIDGATLSTVFITARVD